MPQAPGTDVDMLSQRLLSLLQLTRMALVFTAISNSLTEIALWAQKQAGPTGSYSDYLDHRLLLAIAIISVGLYGFGMSLNDIIDQRRDRLLASHRPLPSGRIGVRQAHAICALMLLSAGLAGLYLAQRRLDGTMSLILLCWTAALIVFYDFAGKYLVAPGLLALGLIRFFHALIPAPSLPLLWHPLLLLNHVTILSLVCYRLEDKRPPLTPIHWWAVLGGLGCADALSIAAVWWKRGSRLGTDSFVESLSVTPALLYPALAIVVFVVLAIIIRRLTPDPRMAGQKLMLFGLLWLIAYDATFVASHVALKPALQLLLLLPIAYLFVQIMRWWGKILSLSQKPQYQRARS